jgi:hypothetical protein
MLTDEKHSGFPGIDKRHHQEPAVPEDHNDSLSLCPAAFRVRTAHMNHTKQPKEGLHQPRRKPWDNAQNATIFPERSDRSGQG